MKYSSGKVECCIDIRVLCNTHIHIYTHTHAYLYTYRAPRWWRMCPRSMYLCVHMYACMYVCIYVIICMCVSMRLYVCMYVCMYIYTYTYIHAYRAPNRGGRVRGPTSHCAEGPHQLASLHRCAPATAERAGVCVCVCVCVCLVVCVLVCVSV